MKYINVENIVHCPLHIRFINWINRKLYRLKLNKIIDNRFKSNLELLDEL